jgi:hypothetical protein
VRPTLIPLALIALLCVAATPAHDDHHPAAAAAPTTAVAPHNQPALPSEHVRWPGAMVIIVAGMFLAAAIIGPVVRANLPDEPPTPHHEDHGADHGQGGHGH